MAENSSEYALDPIARGLGAILEVLFKEESEKKPRAIPCRELFQEMPDDLGAQRATLLGALAVLRGMGLVRLDERGRVEGISRHARFALGSLGRFMTASTPVAEMGVDDLEQDYLISLTMALESVRVEKAQVDQEPLHSRRIVNLLVKSRQVRRWRLRDVYLHVYDPQWRQYRLVGLSHKGDSKTDEEIAKLALEKQVGLEPHQYVLDPAFNPQEKVIRRISVTSGALTEYTYRLMAVKELRVRKLKLRKLMEGENLDQNRFRWFTWDEILCQKSEQGEPIMFSTPSIMGVVDISHLPISAPHADDIRRPVRLLSDLSYRLTQRQLLAIAAISLIYSLAGFLPRLLNLINRSIPLLDNLANIAEFGTGVVYLVIFLSAGWLTRLGKS